MKFIFRVFKLLVSAIVAAAIVYVLGTTVFSDTQVGALIQSLDIGELVQGITDSTSTTAVNTAIEASGIKETIESKLEANVSAIASKTGLSESQVKTAIDNLAISEWEATTLPDDATETGSYDVSYDGTSATITTYSDSSYVTVDVYGQEVTFAVPESAQGYTSYLQYLSYLS